MFWDVTLCTCIEACSGMWHCVLVLRHVLGCDTVYWYWGMFWDVTLCSCIEACSGMWHCVLAEEPAASAIGIENSLLPSRWKQQVPLKRQYMSTKLHSVTFWAEVSSLLWQYYVGLKALTSCVAEVSTSGMWFSVIWYVVQCHLVCSSVSFGM
jgi:hypothetical protein